MEELGLVWCSSSVEFEMLLDVIILLWIGEMDSIYHIPVLWSLKLLVWNSLSSFFVGELIWTSMVFLIQFQIDCYATAAFGSGKLD